MNRCKFASVAVLLLLAGCGGSAAQSISQQDNITACEHYKVQRAAVKAIVYPTLADVLKFQTGLDADNEDATPGTPLFRDLTIFTTDEEEITAAIGNSKARVPSVYAVSVRVLKDCEALGVKF